MALSILWPAPVQIGLDNFLHAPASNDFLLSLHIKFGFVYLQ